LLLHPVLGSCPSCSCFCSLKSDKNNVYFAWDQYTFLIISCSIALKWDVFQTTIVEKIKTHFMVNFFFFENRVVCEIILKNSAEPGGHQITIWPVHIACLICKATTLRICNT
jgi:hypothetical protein